MTKVKARGKASAGKTVGVIGLTSAATVAVGVAAYAKAASKVIKELDRD